MLCLLQLLSPTADSKTLLNKAPNIYFSLKEFMVWDTVDPKIDRDPEKRLQELILYKMVSLKNLTKISAYISDLNINKNNLQLSYQLSSV